MLQLQLEKLQFFFFNKVGKILLKTYNLFMKRLQNLYKSYKSKQDLQKDYNFFIKKHYYYYFLLVGLSDQNICTCEITSV